MRSRENKERKNANRFPLSKVVVFSKTGVEIVKTKKKRSAMKHLLNELKIYW